MIEFLGWAIATVLVAVTIGLHYEIMRTISDGILPWALKRFHDRRVMLLMIAMLMLAHIAEIWIFALSMIGMSYWPELGHLTGSAANDAGAFVYFSAVSYTSLGFGDISPHGAMRSIAASEALIGLLMIAWSASFTYLKMEQIWDMRRKHRE